MINNENCGLYDDIVSITNRPTHNLQDFFFLTNEQKKKKKMKRGECWVNYLEAVSIPAAVSSRAKLNGPIKPRRRPSSSFYTSKTMHSK